MGNKIKELYMADNIGSLETFICRKMEIFVRVSARECCSFADRFYAEAMQAADAGDEERAYVMYMKYMEAVSVIRGKTDYQSDSRFYDSLLGFKKFERSLNACESLKQRLELRYKTKLQNMDGKDSNEHQPRDSAEQAPPATSNSQRADSKSSRKSSTPSSPPASTGDTHVRGSKSRLSSTQSPSSASSSLSARTEGAADIKNSINNSSKRQEDSVISCAQLHALLHQRSASLLVIDVRSAADFAASHVAAAAGCVVNVDAALLQPGVTAPQLETQLPDADSRQLFARRGTVDQLVVCGWTGGDGASLAAASPLAVMLDAMCRWDVTTRRYRCRPRVLSGGYRLWLHSYPMLTTDPHVPTPPPPAPTTTFSSSSADVTIRYPSLEQLTLPDGGVRRQTRPQNVTVPTGVDASVDGSGASAGPTQTKRASAPLAPGIPSRNLKPNLEFTKLPRDTDSHNSVQHTHTATLGDRWQVEQQNLREENASLKARLLDLEQTRVNTRHNDANDIGGGSDVSAPTRDTATPTTDDVAAAGPTARRTSPHSGETSAGTGSVSSSASQDDGPVAARSGKPPASDAVSRQRGSKIGQPSTQHKFQSAGQGGGKSAGNSGGGSGGETVPKPAGTKDGADRITPATVPAIEPAAPANSTTTATTSIISAADAAERRLNDTTRSRPERQAPSSSGSQSGQKENASSSSCRSSSPPSLKRSHSSPYIAQMVRGVRDGQAAVSSPAAAAANTTESATEWRAPTLPSYTRDNKPSTRATTASVQAARARHFAPTYGHVGCALTGLKNLGNTCYMNAVVQCVNNTPGLSDFFVLETYRSFVNSDNTVSGGAAVEELAAVVKALWSGHYRSIAMHDMKQAIGRLHAPFSGNSQQDAHEFLMYLLDYLHEDLNEVKNKHALKEQENDGVPDAQAARAFWSDFRGQNRSFILNLFFGQLRSAVTCARCGHQSVKYEAFSHLSVPMPDRSRGSSRSARCSLYECVRLYLAGETVDGFRCCHCKHLTSAAKTLNIWSLPPILVIHLQRFYHDGLWRKKHAAVDFPLNALNMTDYVINTQARYRTSQYQLYGVVNHFGSMEGGHYTALCRHPASAEWHKFDDQEVQRVKSPPSESASAYILFYSAIDSKLC